MLKTKPTTFNNLLEATANKYAKKVVAAVATDAENRTVKELLVEIIRVVAKIMFIIRNNRINFLYIIENIDCRLRVKIVVSI